MSRRGEPAVGLPLARREDFALLVGRGPFADDLDADDLVEVAFVRSPVAHARLGSLQTAAAEQVPGVHAVLTAADLNLPPLVSPCSFPNSYSPPRPLLAQDVVRFVGEPIAVVAATTRYAAEDAAELIDLDFVNLDPVASIEAALHDDAPRLHEARANVYVESELEVGEVSEAFSAAAAVVTCEFRHSRVSAAPLEGRGILAAPTPSGLRVWSSTQGPHKLKIAICEILGVADDDVQVVCPEIGGGFGLKAHVYPEELIVVELARRLGRPVRWTEDRVENLVASSHAREQRLTVRAAADAHGRLTAIDVEQFVDQGAYGSYPHGPTLEAHTTSGLIPGPYRLGAYRLKNSAVATTKCPQGAYRGVGFVVAAWVHERVMDSLSTALGMDRAEIRRRNLIGAEEFPYETLTRQRYDSGDYVRALDLALDAIGYEEFALEKQRARSDGRFLGLGMSCYVEPTGMNSAVFQARGMIGIEGFDGAHVSIDEQGIATVWTTTPSIGQGTTTTFAQLVADALGTEVEKVRVERSDTAVGGLAGTGAFASRSAVSAGGAVVEASTEIRRRLLRDASEQLEAAPEDMEIAEGAVFVVGSPDISVPIRDLIAAAPDDRYRFSAQWDPPAVAYPYATHACVVEVDPDSGAVTILRYVVTEDCGRVINPVIVDGQIQGATAQGIAEALYEQVLYDDDGQIQSGSFMDYLLPTACEVPHLDIQHLETPAPNSVWGIKGVGEGGTVGAPGAVANAVCDAVGEQIDTLPLTPELVHAAIRRFRSSSGTKAAPA